MQAAWLTNHAFWPPFCRDNLSFSPLWGGSGAIKYVFKAIYA